MKNHKQKNNKNKTPIVAKKKSTVLRNVFLGVLCIGLFFSSMYGFRCLALKVCESVVIDKFVRNDMTVLMPKGALEVEVADTNASRSLGLAGRKSMRSGEGMLFVFDVPGRYGWWVKDMMFPVDIVWINENGIVVNIEREVSPDSYKEKKTFINQSDATYVLEMNAGEGEKHGLYLGSKVKIVD